MSETLPFLHSGMFLPAVRANLPSCALSTEKRHLGLAVEALFLTRLLVALLSAVEIAQHLPHPLHVILHLLQLLVSSCNGGMQ